MRKSIRLISIKTFRALLYATVIPNLTSVAESSESYENDLNFKPLNSLSHITQQRNPITEIDFEIGNIYSYYKSRYPESPYAAFDESGAQQLLAMATIIKQSRDSISSSEALSRALHETTTIPLTVNFESSQKIKREEPNLTDVLNYYKMANTKGPFAILNEIETQQLLEMATIVKHFVPDLSVGTALTNALRILFSEPIKPQLIQIVKEEKNLNQ